MKLLHTADWHLRDRDIEECEKCLAFLVDTARAEAIDLVVIAGDIFDKEDVALKSKAALLAISTVSALADIAPVAIVTGTSSHEGTAPEILAFARGKHPIKVASTPDQWRAMIGGQEVILTMIPQPTKQFFQTRSGIEAADQEIGQAMGGLFAGFGAQAANYPGVPHILVYHGCISGGQASNGQLMTGRDIEVSRDQLALSGASLILCGHLHLPQELPGNIFYSGSIYANNIGEDHKHGFYVHNLTDTTAGRTNIWEYKETPYKRTMRIQDDYTIGGVGELPEISTEDFRGAHVRHEITVWQDEAAKVDKAAIEKYFMDAAALSVDIRITTVPRENIRAEAVLKAETLRDEIQAMAELRGEELEPDVLLKAELLENTPGEELLERVAGGAL